MSSVFELHDSSNDLIEENSSDQTPSPPVATSIVDCSSTPLTTGSSLVESFIMFEKSAKNNQDVIKECHNAFLERYLEKNRIGRKSKLHNTIKCKLTNASSGSGCMSRSCTNDKSKMKLSKSYDATSRSYSSLNSNLTDYTFNDKNNENTSIKYYPASKQNTSSNCSLPIKSTVSDRMTVSDNINYVNQQCYSLNLNALNFYDEQYSTSVQQAYSFRHNNSFSEFSAPFNHGSSSTSYIDQQRQHFSKLDTLSENVIDGNNTVYHYVNINDPVFNNNSKTSNILNCSNSYGNNNMSNRILHRDDYDILKNNKYLKYQQINEENFKSFNYEPESKLLKFKTAFNNFLISFF